MSKHTPGPWRVAQLSDYVEVVDSGGRSVASLDYDEDERIANARLIVAAPDLLAACKAALTVIEDCFDGVDDAFKDAVDVKLRAAIAKAEGGAK